MIILEIIMLVISIVVICMWPIMAFVTLVFTTEYEAHEHLMWHHNPRLNKLGVFCVSPFRFYVNSAIHVGIFLKPGRLVEKIFYN